MKTIHFNFLTLLFIAISFTSCSNDDDAGTITSPVVTSRAENIPAPQQGGGGQPASGDFTKFSFSTGAVVANDSNDWDIAFRGSTIAINGGQVTGTTDEPARTGTTEAIIVDGTFASITSAPETGYTQDSTTGFSIPTGSGNGWYTYTGPPNHLILPIAGKVIVFKTSNGNYAKVEILSYYKDAPTNPDGTDSRFFTFNYTYNPNVGDRNF